MSQLQGKLRKAAVLVASLDQHQADALLDQMPAEYAARVRSAVMQLDDISPAEQQQVIQEFLSVRPSHVAPADSGVELDESLERTLRAAQYAHHQQQMGTDEAEETAERSPFRFLHEAAGETLAKFLEHQHPQIAAVVLSHLPPARAADVLNHVDQHLQAEVLRRISELDETDPEILQELEDDLESLLSEQLQTVRRRSAGLAAVGAILAAADKEQRRELVKNLQQRDQQLAAQLRDASFPGERAVGVPSPGRAARSAAPPHAVRSVTPAPAADMAASQAPGIVAKRSDAAADRSRDTTAQYDGPTVDFEELVQFDDRSLAAVLRACESQTALLALTGAAPKMVERLLRQLPAREAKQLRRRMESIGPLRLRDVEHAQQRMAQIAGRLLAAGKIQTPAPRRFATAV